MTSTSTYDEIVATYDPEKDAFEGGSRGLIIAETIFKRGLLKKIASSQTPKKTEGSISKAVSELIPNLSIQTFPWYDPEKDILEYGGAQGIELADKILYRKSLEKDLKEDVEILRTS
ncbi:MAG: hypothetical protein KKC19_02005 [Nanoarchaeota archaeon]|nr:hypothetical protein [Nanoarchaeota archaeon]